QPDPSPRPTGAAQGRPHPAPPRTNPTDGGWRMADGGRRMADGGWRNGPWPLILRTSAVGHPPSLLRHRPPATRSPRPAPPPTATNGPIGPDPAGGGRGSYGKG